MDVARLVLDFLRVLLSWPVILGLLGVYFLIAFQEPIADVLRRFTKAAGYGVSLEAGNLSQQLQEIKETEITRPVEDDLQKYVKENPELVITRYVQTFNAYWFERSFHLIFGTQIALLEFLLERKTVGEAYVNLELYYREYVQRGGAQTFQFADYLGFLRIANFIRYEGNPIRVYITDYGLDFISYLRAQYAPIYRSKRL